MTSPATHNCTRPIRGSAGERSCWDRRSSAQELTLEGAQREAIRESLGHSKSVMRKQQNHEDTEPQDKYKPCEQRGRASEATRSPEWTEHEGDRRLHGTRVQLHDPGRLGSPLPLWVPLSCPCSLERTIH